MTQLINTSSRRLRFRLKMPSLQERCHPSQIPENTKSRMAVGGSDLSLVLDQCRLVSSQLCFLGLLDRKMIPFSINLLGRGP